MIIKQQHDHGCTPSHRASWASEVATPRLAVAPHHRPLRHCWSSLAPSSLLLPYRAWVIVGGKDHCARLTDGQPFRHQPIHVRHSHRPRGTNEDVRTWRATCRTVQPGAFRQPVPHVGQVALLSAPGRSGRAASHERQSVCRCESICSGLGPVWTKAYTLEGSNWHLCHGGRSLLQKTEADKRRRKSTRPACMNYTMTDFGTKMGR